MAERDLIGGSDTRQFESRRLMRALAGFAALAIAGTCAVFGIDTWRLYNSEIQRITEANAGAAHTLEEHTARSVQAINLVLSGVADFLRTRPEFARPGDPEIFNLLRRRAEAAPELTAIIIVDRNGRLIYHTGAPTPKPLDLSDRTYFTAQRDDSTIGLKIVEPFLGRQSNRWLIGMSRRIDDANGNFAGVVVGVVAPKFFSDHYAIMRPAQDGSVALFLRNGIYLARDPEHDRFLGRSAADTALFAKYLPRRSVGTYQTESADDRVRRVVAYRALPNYPLVVAVAVSLDAVVANWRRNLLERGVVALAIGLIFAVIAYVMIRQIRRRMASEAALAGLGREIERKSAQLEIALANMSQGLCMYDVEQRLILCNQRYLEIYNLPAALVQPGVTLRQIMEISVRIGNYTPDQAPGVIDERLAIGGSQESHVFRQHLATGRSIEVLHHPLAVGGFVATYTDITDQENVTTDLRAAKEQAEIANRTKSEFLANMSHELRTPLNAIIGFSQIMSGEMFGPLGSPRYREYAGDIVNSSQHLLQIINDILDMAKIEAGRVELHETSIDMPVLVQSCLRLMRDRADAAGVRLRLGLADRLPPLLGDERLVKQVLLNLLSNAVKFTPRNGQVTVAAQIDAEGGWRLAVIDTGIGIAPENIPKVMTPFGQIDGTYSRAHGGTGLGLSIVRALIELHGATFQLDSIVGEGTTVTIRFAPARVLPSKLAINAIG